MKTILLIALLIVLGGIWQLDQTVNKPGPLSSATELVIPKGTGLAAAANLLEQAGIIRYPLLFRGMARFNGLDKKLKAGEYRFEAESSLKQVMDKIVRGEVYYRKLTLPEGLTSREMLEIIAAEPMLDGEISLYPEDGELLPETYSFLRGEKRDSLIRRAQLAMQKLKDAVWEQREAGLPLKTSEEMMVLASIIEKETAVAEERELVSAVFINRLKKGMRLQTDPTVIYALTEGKSDLGRPLLRKDLEVDSPYNTYKYFGLPPKPICNPGRAAVEAAAHPEFSDYLYFVADGTGGHNFASSLDQHNENVSFWKKKRKNHFTNEK